MLETIRDLGLELQVIFNKGAVMVLPSGINKASALYAALTQLGLSPHNVVGIGDAENDHAFMQLCECVVAVSNALPMVQERADYVTAADHGAGVVGSAPRAGVRQRDPLNEESARDLFRIARADAAPARTLDATLKINLQNRRALREMPEQRRHEECHANDFQALFSRDCDLVGGIIEASFRGQVATDEFKPEGTGHEQPAGKGKAYGGGSGQSKQERYEIDPHSEQQGRGDDDPGEVEEAGKVQRLPQRRYRHLMK